MIGKCACINCSLTYEGGEYVGLESVKQFHLMFISILCESTQKVINWNGLIWVAVWCCWRRRHSRLFPSFLLSIFTLFWPPRELIQLLKPEEKGTTTKKKSQENRFVLSELHVITLRWVKKQHSWQGRSAGAGEKLEEGQRERGSRHFPPSNSNNWLNMLHNRLSMDRAGRWSWALEGSVQLLPPLCHVCSSTLSHACWPA